jgi:hypothetical protein
MEKETANFRLFSANRTENGSLFYLARTDKQLLTIAVSANVPTYDNNRVICNKVYMWQRIGRT